MEPCRVYQQFARGYESYAETPLDGILAQIARPNLNIERSVFEAAMRKAKITPIKGRFGTPVLSGPQLMAVCIVLDAQVDEKRRDETILESIEHQRAVDQRFEGLRHYNHLHRKEADREARLEALAEKKATAARA